MRLFGDIILKALDSPRMEDVNPGTPFDWGFGEDTKDILPSVLNKR
jgi:hypothetical protein